MKGIEMIWQQYVEELKGQIQTTAPKIVQHVEETVQIIWGIMNEIKDKILAALKALSDCSSEVFPEFLGSMRNQLAPMFERSLEIKGT